MKTILTEKYRTEQFWQKRQCSMSCASGLEGKLLVSLRASICRSAQQRWSHQCCDLLGKKNSKGIQILKLYNEGERLPLKCSGSLTLDHTTKQELLIFPGETKITNWLELVPAALIPSSLHGRWVHPPPWAYMSL